MISLKISQMKLKWWLKKGNRILNLPLIIINTLSGFRLMMNYWYIAPKRSNGKILWSNISITWQTARFCRKILRCSGFLPKICLIWNILSTMTSSQNSKIKSRSSRRTATSTPRISKPWTSSILAISWTSKTIIFQNWHNWFPSQKWRFDQMASMATKNR